jgi:autotransporter-associated beta strand protein
MLLAFPFQTYRRMDNEMKMPKTSPTLNSSRSRQLKSCVTAVALISAAIVSRADHFYTNNAPGDYNVPANWDPNGVPNDNTHNNNGTNNFVIIQAGDPVWNHGDTLAGSADNTAGAWLQTGSTNNTGGGNWLRMGLGINSLGAYVLSNGTVNVGGRIQIGERGTGYLEISGGTMRANVNDAGANPGLVAADGNFASVGNNSPLGIVVLNSGTLNIGNGEVWFGNGGNDINSRGTGHFIMHGGTFNINNWFVFGRFGAAGDGFMDGGVINKNNNGNVQIGVGSMNSGGTPGQGYFTQIGGTFNCGSEYQIGTDATITQATNDIGGNAILIVDNWLAVGRSGATGVLNISNNAAITKTGVNGGNITIGTGSTGNGTVNQNGGTVTNTATQTWISEGGTGTWNMNSGSAMLGTVILNNDSAGNATLNLNGGLFHATSVSSPNATAVSIVNFNGGTLQAGADNVNFISDITLLEVNAGGVVIDSQGFNIGIPEALNDSGGGGLTKLGSGILTLSGGNNYVGNTVISAGALATTTASTGGGGYTLADNTTLGVTVTSGGAQLNMANATLASSTAATLNVDLGAFGNPAPSAAPVNVSGSLAVNGVITINIADGFPQLGQFPLIKYGGRTGSGSFVLGSLPIGVTASLSNNVANSSVDLVINGVNQPRWDGQAGGTWDTGADTNWINIGTGLPTTYSDPSSVVFDDNALGTTTVNLATTVNPNGVTVNNNSLSYVINGSGKISGTTSVTKTGNGALVIANTGNNYTGKTIVSGGTLTVSNLANGGSPSPIGASSASPTNLVLSGGTLVYSGSPVAINRGYSLQGVNTNSGIDAESNLTLSGVVTAAAGDGFIKTGPARLAYTTVGSNNLSAANYLVQAGALLLDGSAGPQTNAIAGTLSIDGTVSAAATLTNTTVIANVNVGIGDAMSTVGTMEVDSGATLTANSWFLLGDGANATASLTMNGGTISVPNGRLFLCSAPGTMATFNMNGGTINKSGDYFAIVNGGWNGTGARTGVVNQVNGTINCQSECWVGDSGNPDHSSLGIYNLSGGTLTLGSWFGVGRDGTSGIFNMTGGTLNKAGGGDMVIGRGGSSGTFIMSAGTINKDPGNPIIVGQGQGVGEFDMSGGTLTSGAEYWLGVDNGTLATNNISGTAQINIHNWVTVGRNGTGVVNMSGGQFNADTQPFIVGIWGGSQGVWNQSAGLLNVNQEIWIGQGGGDPNSHGTLNLTGGAITNTSWLAVGREAGQGNLNISGGTMVKTGGGNISITHNSGATGNVTLSGTGTFICASGETWVGENGGPGTWTMNGGTAILGLVHLAQNGDATGVLSLNGGSLTATEISTGNNGATQRELDFNGGTLVAGADNANFIHDLTAANVQAGGAIIDTAGQTVAVNQALLDAGGGGGLTKVGAGTLRLNGINTYTGTTLVNAGTLGGSGTIAGPLNVTATGTLAPGNSIGTLTVNNSATLGGATVMEISKDGGVPASDLLAVSGNLAYGGTLTVVLTGTNILAYNDTFNLFDWGTRSGSFSAINLPAGYYWDTSQLNVNGTIRVLAVSPANITSSTVSGGNLVLQGAGGPPGTSYSWLTSTNVTAPISAWTTNSTGVFDSNGNFSNAFPTTTVPARFFRLKTP